MRLVWTVLPLIVFCIVEVSESFAEENISVHVDGGHLLNIVHIDDLGSINFEIDMQNHGSVTIELPKGVWHIADSECKSISPMILVDGKETTFTERFDKNKRIITINVVKDSKIIELIVSGPSAPHTTSLMYGQFCLLQEQKIFPSPKKQMDLGFMLHDVQCKDTLVKIIKSSNGSPLCVYPKTAEKLIERGWGSKLETMPDSKIPTTPLDKNYTLQVNENVFEIRYSIIGSLLQEITVDPNSRSIIVNLENSGKGHLTIELPRKFIDARIGSSGTFGDDIDFFILVDDSEVDFEESSDQFQRTLTIPFENDASQIEIILGTFPYP